MHNVALLHERQTKKHLVSICPNRSQVDADVFAKALHDVPKVHTVSAFQLFVATWWEFSAPHTLKYEAKMAAMLEGAFEPDEMVFGCRVSVLQLAQNAGLLLTSFVPVSTEKTSTSVTEGTLGPRTCSLDSERP